MERPVVMWSSRVGRFFFIAQEQPSGSVGVHDFLSVPMIKEHLLDNPEQKMVDKSDGFAEFFQLSCEGTPDEYTEAAINWASRWWFWRLPPLGAEKSWVTVPSVFVEKVLPNLPQTSVVRICFYRCENHDYHVGTIMPHFDLHVVYGGGNQHLTHWDAVSAYNDFLQRASSKEFDTDEEWDAAIVAASGAAAGAAGAAAPASSSTGASAATSASFSTGASAPGASASTGGSTPCTDDTESESEELPDIFAWVPAELSQGSTLRIQWGDRKYSARVLAFDPTNTDSCLRVLWLGQRSQTEYALGYVRSMLSSGQIEIMRANA